MTKTYEPPQQGFSQSNSRALRNPWVLGWIALVVIVLSVNIAMISMAFLSNPGLVVDDYYERGKDYEKTVNARIAAREALGWNLSLEMDRKPVQHQPSRFLLTAADKVGQPLRGAEVKVHAYRPSDADADFDATLREGRPGQYAGELNFPLKGFWELKMTIRRGEDRYDVSRRVMVAAQ